MAGYMWFFYRKLLTILVQSMLIPSSLMPPSIFVVFDPGAGMSKVEVVHQLE